MTTDLKPGVAEVRLLESDEQRYRRHDAAVQRLTPAVLEWVESIQAIRDHDLWKFEFPTFEDYCRTRIGMSIRQVQRLAASQLVRFSIADPAAYEHGEPDESEPDTQDEQTERPRGRSDDPDCQNGKLGNMPAELAGDATEYHLRQLGRLKTPAEQREAWSLAVELNGGEVPTARRLGEVVDHLLRHTGSLAAAVATEAGVPESVARAALAAADLAPDDRKALREVGLTPEQIARVARVTPPAERKRLVTAMCYHAGRPDLPGDEGTFDGVWRRTFPPDETVADVNGGPTGRKPSEDDLDDEEWLRRLPLLGKLVQQDLYRMQSLLWRHNRQAIRDYHNRLKAAGIGEKGARVIGFATREMLAPVRLKHPFQWLLCAKCSGTGSVALPGGRPIECGTCAGGGFRG